MDTFKRPERIGKQFRKGSGRWDVEQGNGLINQESKEFGSNERQIEKHCFDDRKIVRRQKLAEAEILMFSMHIRKEIDGF